MAGIPYDELSDEQKNVILHVDDVNSEEPKRFPSRDELRKVTELADVDAERLVESLEAGTAGNFIRFKPEKKGYVLATRGHQAVHRIRAERKNVWKRIIYTCLFLIGAAGLAAYFWMYGF